MPGGGWAILIVAALIVFVLGLIYAFLHAKKAMTGISKTADDIQVRVAKMTEKGELLDRDRVPAFAKPIKASADVYSKAHEEVLEGKRRRSQRHRATWDSWAETDKKTINGLGQKLGIPAEDLLDEND